MDVRVNKFISDSGYCSRRDADRMIEKRKVTINRKVATLGDRVKAGDEVRINGNLIENNVERLVYIALNKPVGVTSTTDREDKSSVLNFMRFPMRIFHIGRLDKDSEGLLLLTNDGDIVNKILRVENSHDKEYEVWVDKKFDNAFLEKMASGVEILGTRTRPCTVEREGENKFRITLTQGLNRQIRRMCEALGYEVLRLRRVRIMNIEVGGMNTGDWRFIEGEELETLFASLKYSVGQRDDSAGGDIPRTYKRARKPRFFNSEPRGENTQESRGDKPTPRRGAARVSSGSKRGVVKAQGTKTSRGEQGTSRSRGAAAVSSRRGVSKGASKK
ncbi:MAG: pseudouridine synthase [Rikenellaceae bacterium]